MSKTRVVASIVVPAAAALAAAGLLAACAPKAPAPAAAVRPKGHLFIVGGGDRDEPLMRRYVGLARRRGPAKIVVFTMASGVPLETGPEIAAEFKGYGVEDVACFHLTRDEALDPASLGVLDGATGVWFSGGDQAKLTAVLLDTPLHRRMLELYDGGGLVGGTSAGAAVMSEFMITGDERRTGNEEGTWEVIWADDVLHSRGFGFVKDAVIDQHFVTRRRHNRLMAVVLQYPALVGVGIEESTAVLVRPDGKYEVLGEGQVVVYDARRAVTARSPDGRLGGRDLRMHVLLAGDVYDLGTGRVEAAAR
ncbi:MAG TPA: cyanophycinase [Candidatus Aminicenantes bacterium]|nr:cyanophycinase [Candidatus Aminicenantes bacterium]